MKSTNTTKLLEREDQNKKKKNQLKLIEKIAKDS